MAVTHTQVANIAFFREPLFSQTLAYAREGIWNPTEEDLSPVRHARLYRVGHSIHRDPNIKDSRLIDEMNLSSPWWSDYQAIQGIRHFAERNSISMTIASRINNAQTPDFGLADLLYTIDLALPVRTLRGLGRDMKSGGRTYRPSPLITQTYVPGLGDWKTKTLT